MSFGAQNGSEKNSYVSVGFENGQTLFILTETWSPGCKEAARSENEKAKKIKKRLLEACGMVKMPRSLIEIHLKLYFRVLFKPNEILQQSVVKQV